MATFSPWATSTANDSTLLLCFSHPCWPGPLFGRWRDALTRAANALACIQEDTLHCPRSPHLHCDNAAYVTIPEEGMSVMRLSVRHGVRPRTLLVLAVLVLASCQTRV
jgi:hypothetical protein